MSTITITLSWGTAKNLKENVMEQDENHLNHSTWECKYHVVFAPKVPQESAVWEAPAEPGKSVSRSGAAKGVPD